MMFYRISFFSKRFSMPKTMIQSNPNTFVFLIFDTIKDGKLMHTETFLIPTTDFRGSGFLAILEKCHGNYYDSTDAEYEKELLSLKLLLQQSNDTMYQSSDHLIAKEQVGSWRKYETKLEEPIFKKIVGVFTSGQCL